MVASRYAATTHRYGYSEMIQTVESKTKTVTVAGVTIPLDYIADSVSLLGWAIYLSKQGATVAEVREFARMVREAKGWAKPNGPRRTQSAPGPPGATQTHCICNPTENTREALGRATEAHRRPQEGIGSQ